MNLTRRQALALAQGAVAIALIRPGPAQAAAADTQVAMEAFAAGAPIQDGRIRLTAPEIAENGNSVPIGVTVDSEMTEEDRVEAVMILAEGNPRPEVATFRFGPLAGSAEATTRMRLAETQNVIALAKMKDGSVFKDQAEVKVTIGGCGG